jgi:hypothetical protein
MRASNAALSSERGDTMGAKPKKTGSAAKVPAKKKRAPARRVPARKAASKSGRTPKVRAATAPARSSVEAYVAGLAGDQGGAARRLRELVMSAAPSASESIKWGQPVYEDNGPFCYFKANSDHITFGFWRGTELDDPDGRLEGDGDRMKHIKIRDAGDIEEDLFADWVRQAVDLNRRFGNPTRQATESEDVDVDIDADDDGGVTPREDEPTQRVAPRETETWPGGTKEEDDDERDFGEPREGSGSRRIETARPIENVVDPGSDRFHDDEFEPSWKDGER